MSQLALPLQLADHAVFSSFHATGNEELVELLRGISNSPRAEGCWIWGAAASGKTHLLQAVCAEAGDQAVYIPMSLFADAGPDIVNGLESRKLVCLDDMDRVAGSETWERALFSLYNELLNHNGQLIAAARTTPRDLSLRLPDLASRMSTLPAYKLQLLDDSERATALQLRASHRGLHLPDETARYLLNRSRRDMQSLYSVLDMLDQEALRAQRRLTIPFVSNVMKKNQLLS